MTAAPGIIAPPRALTTMQPFFREASVNRETGRALLDGLSAFQLGWRPAPTVWGLADICGHLATTSAVYLPALDTAIAAGHARAAYSDHPFRGSTLSRLMVWLMEPPARLRLRAPAMLRPAGHLDPLDARDAYIAAQRAFDLRLERAAGLDLTHVLMTPPTLPRLRFTLGAALALLLAHERRHLWQATVVRQDREFPES